MTRTRWIAALIVALLLAELSAVGADASASTTVRLGSHGAVTLTRGGPNRVSVSVRALVDGAWTAGLYLGSCAHVGAQIVALPSLRVVGGVARRTTVLSAAQARTAQRGLVRIARGHTTYCAPFGNVIPVPSTPRPTRLPSPSPTPLPVVDLAGTWHVTTGSWAGYRVQVRTLLGSSEKVGRTTVLAGQSTVETSTGAGTLTSSDFTADLRTLSSGDTQTDRQVAASLETDRCPTGEVVQTAWLTLPVGSTTPDGADVVIPARLTLHCVTHDEVIAAHVGRTGGPFHLSGSLTFRLADFNISRTVAGGAGTLAETGTFEFSLLLQR